MLRFPLFIQQIAFHPSRFYPMIQLSALVEASVENSIHNSSENHQASFKSVTIFGYITKSSAIWPNRKSPVGCTMCYIFAFPPHKRKFSFSRTITSAKFNKVTLKGMSYLGHQEKKGKIECSWREILFSQFHVDFEIMLGLTFSSWKDGFPSIIKLEG